jgi:hypothetical protein
LNVQEQKTNITNLYLYRNKLAYNNKKPSAKNFGSKIIKKKNLQLFHLILRAKIFVIQPYLILSVFFYCSQNYYNAMMMMMMITRKSG